MSSRIATVSSKSGTESMIREGKARLTESFRYASGTYLDACPHLHNLVLLGRKRN